MVIPYAGALQFFLAFFSVLPLAVRTFVTTSIAVTLGVGFFKFILDYTG